MALRFDRRLVEAGAASTKRDSYCVGVLPARRKKRPQMAQKFGAAYEIYRKTVAMFFPKQGEWRKLVSAGRFRESEQ